MPDFPPLPKLDWIEVSSTNLAALAVDGADLWVRFVKTGAVYRYPRLGHMLNVLLMSDSIGTVFEDTVRIQASRPGIDYERWA